MRILSLLIPIFLMSPAFAGHRQAPKPIPPHERRAIVRALQEFWPDVPVDQARRWVLGFDDRYHLNDSRILNNISAVNGDRAGELMRGELVQSRAGEAMPEHRLRYFIRRTIEARRLASARARDEAAQATVYVAARAGLVSLVSIGGVVVLWVIGVPFPKWILTGLSVTYAGSVLPLVYQFMGEHFETPEGGLPTIPGTPALAHWLFGNDRAAIFWDGVHRELRNEPEWIALGVRDDDTPERKAEAFQTLLTRLTSPEKVRATCAQMLDAPAEYWATQ